MATQDDPYGLRSPGGFVFGIAGWHWGEPRPTSITFFLDGTCRVSDQWGRPIKGAVINNKEVKFAQGPPSNDDVPDARKGLATHMQTIAALNAEGIDWLKLTCAGWPQIPYEMLRKLPVTPPTPIEELIKIKDPALRKDAVRMRREADEAMEKELGIILEEIEQ